WPSPGGCYDRCCWIFCSNIGFGYAPTSVSTCRPSLKNRILGIERTLKRIAVFWLASTSTLVTFNLPTYSPASWSRIGVTMWHGPHQVAQKIDDGEPFVLLDLQPERRVRDRQEMFRCHDLSTPSGAIVMFTGNMT